MHPFKTKIKKLNKLFETLPNYAYDLFASETYDNDDQEYKFRVRLTKAFIDTPQPSMQDKAVISLVLADYSMILDALNKVENFDTQKYYNTPTSGVFDSNIISAMIGLYVIENILRPFELAYDYVPMFSNNWIKKIKSNIVKINESIKMKPGK